MVTKKEIPADITRIEALIHLYPLSIILLSNSSLEFRYWFLLSVRGE